MKEFCILAGFAFGIMSSVGASDERLAQEPTPTAIGTMTNSTEVNAAQPPSDIYIPDSVRHIPPGALFR
jgi:hypothetical protein